MKIGLTFVHGWMAVAAWLALSTTTTPLLAAPNVVVSIKPVHSLVSGIMQGVSEPDLLIRGSQSPHDFSLRPSDMQLLRQADLVVWVGPDVEASLARLFEKNLLTARVATLTQLPDVDWLSSRNEGDWETEQHDATAHADHAHHHTSSIDSHIWLSPVIARHIVQQVTELLCELDRANTSRYRKNSQQLIARLAQLDSELASTLSPIRERPFIVFHDAYHYFEQHYDLNGVGCVSLSPDRQPGAQHIHELRSMITHLQARCVFSEPQFEPKLVETLIEGTTAKAGFLDPLGSDLEPGAEAYFLLMHQLAENLAGCLR